MKAGDGPVTLQLLASYGPPKEPVSINGWYASGNGSARTEMFRIAQANAFALDPPIENGGTLSFDPGSSAFGFWNEWPFWEEDQGIGQYVVYLEDSLNTWDIGTGGVQHHVRVYPYKNPDGSPAANAYIVTTEEAPISAGPDYNDIVYVVRNVKPPGSGGGGALELINTDGEPSSGPDDVQRHHHHRQLLGTAHREGLGDPDGPKPLGLERDGERDRRHGRLHRDAFHRIACDAPAGWVV